MSDPTKLRDSEHLDESGRRALEAARGLEPPAGAESRVWTALGSRLPLTGSGLGEGGAGAGSAGTLGAAGAGAGAATGGITVAKLASVLAAVTALGGAGGVVFLAAGESSPLRTAVQPAPIAAPSHAAAGPAPNPASQPGSLPPAGSETSRAGAPAPPTAESGTPASALRSRSPSAKENTNERSNGGPSSPLPSTAAFELESVSTAQPRAGALDASAIAEESRLIGDARLALRANDASTALSLLERAERRFPRGILTQERSALFVEALARAGRRDDAVARARSFLNAFPTSPHASRVRAVLER